MSKQSLGQRQRSNAENLVLGLFLDSTNVNWGQWWPLISLSSCGFPSPLKCIILDDLCKYLRGNWRRYTKHQTVELELPGNSEAKRDDDWMHSHFRCASGAFPMIAPFGWLAGVSVGSAWLSCWKPFNRAHTWPSTNQPTLQTLSIVQYTTHSHSIAPFMIDRPA